MKLLDLSEFLSRIGSHSEMVRQPKVINYIRVGGTRTISFTRVYLFGCKICLRNPKLYQIELIIFLS